MLGHFPSITETTKCETAIIIAYDDSDGWYDHDMGPIVMQSYVTDDQLLAAGSCGQPKVNDLAGGTQNGRYGYGPRLPLLVISPWAKTNYVDHRVTDQSSIEDNWGLPRICNGFADAIAGSLNGMFDFDDGPRAGRLRLDKRRRPRSCGRSLSCDRRRPFRSSSACAAHDTLEKRAAPTNLLHDLRATATEVVLRHGWAKTPAVAPVRANGCNVV